MSGMALLDHFRPPLGVRRHWHAFHNAWATYLASHLNERLPEGYFAEANVQFGIEIDVATFEEPGMCAGGAATGWTAPAPTQTLPVTALGDVAEVLVFDREGGPTLAGAIELVSPANKDRPEHRAAFVSKCATCLQQGVGLVVVDVVTSRLGSLHPEILRRVSASGGGESVAELYASAYRLVGPGGSPHLDIWHTPLTLGGTLPTMPLWLRGGVCLPVDLDATYARTCREQRIPGA